MNKKRDIIYRLGQMWLDQDVILNNYSNYTTVIINLSLRIRVKIQYLYIEYIKKLGRVSIIRQFTLYTLIINLYMLY